jgi:hypothetical protein
VAPTRKSRRTVFRQIAQLSPADWPTDESSPLFDRTSLPGAEPDVRLVAETRFQHDDHEAVELSFSIWPIPRITDLLYPL